MKRYIVNQNGKNEIVSTVGFIPPGVVCQAPEGEVEYLDILEDEAGNKYAQVNETKKAAYEQKLEDIKRAGEFDKLRAERDRRLAATDFTQVSDSPLSENMRKNFAQYRQQLRDLPAYTSDPSKPKWPKEPK